MNYRILVADDECIIRKGIIKLLHKYDGLEVVAEAEDGEQALEIAQKNELNIIFVDINMPFINGLQFIEKLKDIQPDAIVIIITGYDKFEYVRQALRLGVFEYILKPLNEKAFDETIDKAIIFLNKRSEEEKYFNWAKATLDKNKSNLLSDFYEKCISQNYSEDKIKEEIKYLGLNLPEQFTITLIYLERVESTDIRQHWEDDLLYYAAENIAREIFDRLAPILFSSKEYLILICRSETKSILEAMNQEYKSTVEKCIPAKAILIQQSDQSCYKLPSLYEEFIKKMDEIKGYPSIIKKVNQFIETNYYQEDISLIDAAEYVSLSPQHLSRIFKKEVGITFIDYLTQVRINKAIEYFDNDNMKMYEIADKVGYATQHYFSSVFKKVIGVSPLDYRIQCKNANKTTRN